MNEQTGCIVMENVTKYFGQKQILKDLTISVPCGSIYGLLGPSGCGKTTTVKIMAGISEATSGETHVLGVKMPDLSMMNQIGYMAQSDALYMTLSARENLTFFGKVYGLKKGELNNRIDEVMQIVGLENELEKQVQAYSGGMKRRLSLAMSILHNPPVLILDEPTVGIDPLLRLNIWQALYKMTESGTTILVTTHVMDEAEKCSQLAMMREGILLASGTPEEIIARSGADSLEQAFINYGRGTEVQEDAR